MNFLFDLFPVILFFAAFKLADIYVATAVAIATTFVQIAWTWLRTRKISGMLWASFAIVTVFGGMTLFLHDETFIKWKPTVLYWVLALAFIVSRCFGKDLIRALLGAQMTLPEAVWNRLNWAWTGFLSSTRPTSTPKPPRGRRRKLLHRCGCWACTARPSSTMGGTGRPR